MSATSQSLVQRSPARCVCVSRCVWSRKLKRGNLGWTWARMPQTKKHYHLSSLLTINSVTKDSEYRVLLNNGLMFVY